MSKRRKEIEEEIEETTRELKAKGAKGYEKLIDRLDRERRNIRNEIDRDYKEARRYVRSNPEEGMLIALVGGLALGLLLGKLSK